MAATIAALEARHGSIERLPASRTPAERQPRADDRRADLRAAMLDSTALSSLDLTAAFVLLSSQFGGPFGAAERRPVGRVRRVALLRGVS